MIEIRWHGRGGQGVVTAANLLGAAAVREGRYAQSFPFFGAERRGAPVSAFTRIDDKPIRLRSHIYQPGWVVVLDDTLLALVNPTDGLRPGGKLVINTRQPASDAVGDATVIALDASAIGQKAVGRPVANTVILGALAAAGLLQLDSVVGAILDNFPDRTGEANAAAARAAYALVAKQQEDHGVNTR